MFRAVLIITALLLAGAVAQDTTRRTHAQDFRTQGLDSNGRQIWQLTGESADFKGSVIDLKEANARIVGLKNIKTVIHTSAGKAFTFTSSSCQVMLALRELKSDSAIEFSSDGINGSGIGYDVNLEQRIVRIRTTVRFVIKQNTGKNLLQKELEKKDK